MHQSNIFLYLISIFLAIGIYYDSLLFLLWTVFGPSNVVGFRNVIIGSLKIALSLDGLRAEEVAVWILLTQDLTRFGRKDIIERATRGQVVVSVVHVHLEAWDG